MTARLVTLASLVLLSSCSGGRYDTQREACQAVADEFCTRQVECNLTFTDPELCADLLVDDCCEAFAPCDEAPEDADAWGTCEDDFGLLSCESLEQDVPGSCDALL